MHILTLEVGIITVISIFIESFIYSYFQLFYQQDQLPHEPKLRTLKPPKDRETDQGTTSEKTQRKGNWNPPTIQDGIHHLDTSFGTSNLNLRSHKVINIILLQLSKTH